MVSNVGERERLKKLGVLSLIQRFGLRECFIVPYEFSSSSRDWILRFCLEDLESSTRRTRLGVVQGLEYWSPKPVI